jgi:hypothetical protein
MGRAGEVNGTGVVEQSVAWRGLACKLCTRPLCCFGCIAFACVPDCVLFVHREDAYWVRA